MVVDNGNRREFKTGAVRDIDETKGRCDLLPLDIVSKLFKEGSYENEILNNLSLWTDYKDDTYIYEAIKVFGEKAPVSEPWFRIEDMILSVSIHYKDGAEKYEDRNWEKGIPLHSFLDSGVRHLLKFSRGDTDERHDRAFVWNMLGLLWTSKHKPELDDVKK